MTAAFVSLDDANLTVDQARHRGYAITDNGVPAICISDWAKLVDERVAAAQAHDRATDRWRRDTETYESDRVHAATTAGQEAFEQATRAGKSAGAGHAAQVEAGRHAGAQFERTYRRPRFGGDGEPGCQLIFVPEAEEGSRVARVVGKLRGPAKPRQPMPEVAR